MKKILIAFVWIAIYFGCQDNGQKDSTNKCDNTVLIKYFYPLKNKGKTYVYKIESNDSSYPTDIIEKQYKLTYDKDSLLLFLERDTLGVIQDSTIYKIYNGIPIFKESYIRIGLYPNLIPVLINKPENQFCEYTKYFDLYKYEIPNKEGNIIREFKGHTSHIGYEKCEFMGVEYKCAIIESEKTLTVIQNDVKEKFDGIGKFCHCENLGELYGVVKLDNGLEIKSSLIEIK